MWPMGGGGNHAYACTRVKARKAFLLSRDTYSRLLAMDVYEIGRVLGETQYRDEMTRDGARDSGAHPGARAVVEAGKLAPLEDHLDKVLYYDLLRVLKPTSSPDKVLRDFVRREIDVANLKVMLKLKAERIPEDRIMKYLVPGGAEYGLEALRRMAQAEGLLPVVEALEKSSMYETIKPALDRFKDDQRLSGLTIALDKALIGTSDKFAHLYPLSVLPIVNYMIRQ